MSQAFSLPGFLVAAFIGLLFLFKWINVLNEYERAVTFWLGRLGKTPKGPGLVLIFWPFERMVRISLRTVVHDVPPQDVITRDNVSVKVNAVVYFRVVEPEQGDRAGRELSLRDVAARADDAALACWARRELDELLSEREKLNLDLQKIIDLHTEPWGVKVVAGRGQARRPAAGDAAGDGEAGRGRAREAREDHPRRGRAGRPRQRSPKAAEIIDRQPATLQLRYLQTLTEIATEKNSTIVFPLPIDLIKMFLEKP